jgi:protein SCO1/2
MIRSRSNILPWAFWLLTNVIAIPLTLGAASALAQDDNRLPAQLRGVGIEQRLNGQVPMDLVFHDESGNNVHLSDCCQGKPTILVLVYYSCPRLCTRVLSGLLDGLTGLKSFDIGDKFNVVTVSFDPRETPELAAAKKQAYVASYGRSGAEKGWHFLTGDEFSIKQLTDAVGFHYTYDPVLQQFAHASGIMILTPAGKIARYFYGIDYSPSELRLGLVEAADNKIGTPVDQIMLFCFHYDPTTGKYGLAVLNFVRVLGAATLVGLGIMFVVLRRGERQRRQIIAVAKG